MDLWIEANLECDRLIKAAAEIKKLDTNHVTLPVVAVGSIVDGI